MSLEQAIEKLTAAIEAATGVLVALGAKAPGAAAAPAAAAPEAPKRGRPATKTTAAADDAGLGGDDGGLGGDDGGLGGGLGGDEGATPEEAKAAVLAYRDKAIKLKGKDEGLNATRTLMKKHVAALDDINADNAAAVHAAFTTAITKLK